MAGGDGATKTAWVATKVSCCSKKADEQPGGGTACRPCGLRASPSGSDRPAGLLACGAALVAPHADAPSKQLEQHAGFALAITPTGSGAFVNASGGALLGEGAAAGDESSEPGSEAA